MKADVKNMNVKFISAEAEVDEEVVIFGECAYNQKRLCSFDCVALSIMAIPRTRLVKDSQTGHYNLAADREPVVGPFCRRGNFPIGLHADEDTVAEGKKNCSDIDVN